MLFYNVLMKTNALIKTITIVLTVSILAPLVSCSSKNREYEVVKADDPWYESESFMVSDLYSKEDYEYTSFTTIGTVDDIIYVSVDAEKKLPEKTVEMSYNDYFQYFEQSILKLTLEGELIDKTEFKGKTSDGYYRFLLKAWVSDGKLNTLEVTLDPETAAFITYYFNGNEYIPSVNNPYDTPPRLINMYTSGGYTVCLFDLKYGQCITVTKPDGSYVEMIPADIFGEYVEIYEIIPSSGNTVILPGFDENNMLYASLDPETGEHKELEGLMGFYDTEVISTSGKSVARDLNGFNFIDEETGNLTPICEYSDINMSLEDLIESQLLYISDNADEMILAHEKYSSVSSYGYELIHLTKCGTNPHAGKTILTLSNAEMAEPNSSDFYAMKLFNETNDSFFIKYVIPYDMTGEYIETAADILIFEDPIADPSDSNKYVDLAPYLDLESDSYKDEFFTNAIDSAKTGDSLYRVPLDISVSGIITSSVNVPEGQIGFTFEQYLTFVDNVCNGTDPLFSTPGYKMGKSESFTKLFLSMSDMFIKDGKVDLSGEEFRTLIQFVDEYGTDSGENNNDEHSSAVSEIENSIETHNANLEGKLGAVYGSFYSFDRYLDCYREFGEGIGIYGIPSFDGRGPQTVSHEYVSVMAETKYPAACAEFVKLQMSYEAQIKMSYANPINCKALRTIAEADLEYYNEYVLEDGLPDTMPLSSDTIDKFINILSSSHIGLNVGIDVENILREESSSYFSGSKSLDDVIPVMQKRIQTVLDENK